MFTTNRTVGQDRERFVQRTYTVPDVPSIMAAIRLITPNAWSSYIRNLTEIRGVSGFSVEVEQTLAPIFDNLVTELTSLLWREGGAILQSAERLSTYTPSTTNNSFKLLYVVLQERLAQHIEIQSQQVRIQNLERDIQRIGPDVVATVRHLHEQIQNLSAATEDRNRQIEGLNKRISDLNLTANQQANSITNLEQELSFEIYQNNNVEIAYESLAQEASNLSTQINVLQRQVSELEQQKTILETTVQSLSTNWGVTRARVAELTNENLILAEANSSLVNERNNLQGTVEAQSREIARLELDIDRLRDDVAIIRRGTPQVDSHSARLIGALRNQINNANDELKQLQLKVQEKESELMSWWTQPAYLITITLSVVVITALLIYKN